MALVGIPSTNPGGLDAPFGTHFGHCDLYTVINVENGDIKDIRTLPNISHQEGGCLAPVQHLADNGVKILIAGGMGMRPLMGFNQMGIDVYYSGGVPTVGEAVQAFLDGKLRTFNTNQACGDCGN